MRNWIAALLLAAGLAVGVQAATIAPVNAGTPQFCHYSPDDGLDSAIKIITANDARTRTYDVFVAEGRCVTYYTSNDPIAIYIPAHQEIWCKYGGNWRRAFYGGGDGNTVTLFSVFDDGSGCTKRVGS